MALEEVSGPVQHIGIIDDDLFDIILEVVANGPNDHVRLFVYETRLLELGIARLGVSPDANQLLVVLLELRLGALFTGGTDNDAHFFGDGELGDQRLELLTSAFVLDLSADASAARIGHQHQKTTGHGDVGRHRRALVSDLLLIRLHQKFGAGGQAILDEGTSTGFLGRLVPIPPMDVVEGDEPVALSPIIDEGRLEAGLYTDDARLVDIALDELVALHGNIQVFEDTVFYDGHTNLARLGGVDQHSLTHF